MGRLTSHFDYCELFSCPQRNPELAKVNQCNFFNTTSRDKCHEKAVYDKLREYEDLEEQVLKSTGTDLASMVGEFMHYYNLKKENRLLELPCKVGDKVWIIDGQCLYDDECWELNGCENCNLYEAYVTEVTFNVDFYDWMGKTVFLTKEEAEKALAEITEFQKNSEKEVKTEAILAEMGK